MFISVLWIVFIVLQKTALVIGRDQWRHFVFFEEVDQTGVFGQQAEIHLTNQCAMFASLQTFLWIFLVGDRGTKLLKV